MLSLPYSGPAAASAPSSGRFSSPLTSVPVLGPLTAAVVVQPINAAAAAMAAVSTALSQSGKQAATGPTPVAVSVHARLTSMCFLHEELSKLLDDAVAYLNVPPVVCYDVGVEAEPSDVEERLVDTTAAGPAGSGSSSALVLTRQPPSQATPASPVTKAAPVLATTDVLPTRVAAKSSGLVAIGRKRSMSSPAPPPPLQKTATANSLSSSSAASPVVVSSPGDGRLVVRLSGGEFGYSGESLDALQDHIRQATRRILEHASGDYLTYFGMLHGRPPPSQYAYRPLFVRFPSTKAELTASLTPVLDDLEKHVRALRKALERIPGASDRASVSFFQHISTHIRASIAITAVSRTARVTEKAFQAMCWCIDVAREPLARVLGPAVGEDIVRDGEDKWVKLILEWQASPSATLVHRVFFETKKDALKELLLAVLYARRDGDSLVAEFLNDLEEKRKRQAKWSAKVAGI